MIFVFGSNEAGRHGKGAALYAKQNYGAIQGQGFGAQGNSYAIPTKDNNIKTLPLHKIKPYVDVFLMYARLNMNLDFFITKIGCGLAGYQPKDIAPMFKNATTNCRLPVEFDEIIQGLENARKNQIS